MKKKLIVALCIVSNINHGRMGTNGSHVEHYVQVKHYGLKQPDVEQRMFKVSNLYYGRNLLSSFGKT